MPKHLRHPIAPTVLVITNQADFACMQMLPHAVMFIASSDMLMTYACTPEAVQIKAPRLTIYPVTAQEVSTREHEHITRVIYISPRKRMGERQSRAALEPWKAGYASYN